MSRIKFLNIEIDNLTMNEALFFIVNAAKAKKNMFVITPNVHHVMMLQKDDEFQAIYSKADLVLPDGVPLILASYCLKTPLKEKVSGSDLFPAVCGLAVRENISLFFLGGRSGAAERSAQVLRGRYPGLRIVGVYSPPFGFENEREQNLRIIEMIRQANPDILFVGLGAPKQEKWIYKHRDEYRVPVSIGIGVSFEFISGMVKRAPVWMQKVGLEWLWRLIIEPKRLWKRYLIDDMQFLGLILKQVFSKEKKTV